MELQMIVAIEKFIMKVSCKLHLPFSHNAISFHESFFHMMYVLVEKFK
jgi:hypothetical protein